MTTIEQLVAQHADLSDAAAIHAALAEKQPRKAMDLPVWIDDLPEGIVEKIKARAVVMESACDQAGIPEPTKEEVTAAIANIQTRREAGAYWSRVLAVVNPMIDAGNSVDEIKTAVAEIK